MLTSPANWLPQIQFPDALLTFGWEYKFREVEVFALDAQQQAAELQI